MEPEQQALSGHGSGASSSHDLGQAPSAPVSKRPRIASNRQDVAFHRKRATAACRSCRARRVKCNNARPSCESCLKSKGKCVYEDPQDYSPFDPASILMLDKLDEILARVGKAVPNTASWPPVEPMEAPVVNLAPIRTPQSETSSDYHAARHRFDELRIPAAKASPDSVLTWPIFERKYGPSHLIEAVADDERSNAERRDDNSRSRNMSSVQECDVLPLVKRFWERVHIKNPIFEASIVLSYVRSVQENGFQWDGVSCAVLLMCALGSVASDFPTAASIVTAHGGSSIRHRREEVATAERYFSMSRKRIGLLGRTLLAVQCHFLAGIYMMYTLHPLDAWVEFNTASSKYLLYLQYNHQRQDKLGKSAESQQRHLQQRLYWSCYKSECELRLELNLPSSCLADLDFPDMHPSPPDPALFAPNDASSPEVREGSQNALDYKEMFDGVNQEESWYYYLTEITLRRIANRVQSTFYTGEPADWNDQAIPWMVSAAQTFERQLEDWYAQIPAPIAFSTTSLPENELLFLVRDRVMEIRTWLYRPFLYYATHNPCDAPHRALIEPLVQDGIKYSLQAMGEGPICHRHHGTFFAVRWNIAVALVILGAAKCGSVSLPENWQVIARSCIERLRYWEAECPGMTVATEVLETLM